MDLVAMMRDARDAAESYFAKVRANDAIGFRLQTRGERARRTTDEGRRDGSCRNTCEWW